MSECLGQPLQPRGYDTRRDFLFLCAEYGIGSIIITVPSVFLLLQQERRKAWKGLFGDAIVGDWGQLIRDIMTSAEIIGQQTPRSKTVAGES